MIIGLSTRISGLALAVLLGLSTTALAESTGQLNLTIDGEEETVPLWGEQSDWSGGENYPSINIYARAFNENGEDPLVVTLSFDAARWMPDLEEMRISRFEDGERVLNLFGGEDEEEGQITVTLDSHEVNGSTLTLSGSVEGQLGTSENFGNDIDLSNAVTVEGDFTVTLEELEF